MDGWTDGWMDAYWGGRLRDRGALYWQCQKEHTHTKTCNTHAQKPSVINMHTHTPHTGLERVSSRT